MKQVLLASAGVAALWLLDRAASVMQQKTSPFLPIMRLRSGFNLTISLVDSHCADCIDRSNATKNVLDGATFVWQNKAPNVFFASTTTGTGLLSKQNATKSAAIAVARGPGSDCTAQSTSGAV